MIYNKNISGIINQKAGSQNITNLTKFIQNLNSICCPITLMRIKKVTENTLNA